MAAIPYVSPQVQKAYQTGDTDRIIMYALRNVTNGDTIDLATDFVKIRSAFFVAMTGTFAMVAGVAGTVLTLTNALMLNDGGYLLVIGSAAGPIS